MDEEGWDAAAARGALVGSEADAVKLVRDMLAAVAALHSVGVVHADIKVPRFLSPSLISGRPSGQKVSHGATSIPQAVLMSLVIPAGVRDCIQFHRRRQFSRRTGWSGWQRSTGLSILPPTTSAL